MAQIVFRLTEQKLSDCISFNRNGIKQKNILDFLLENK